MCRSFVRCRWCAGWCSLCRLWQVTLGRCRTANLHQLCFLKCSLSFNDSCPLLVWSIRWRIYSICWGWVGAEKIYPQPSSHHPHIHSGKKQPPCPSSAHSHKYSPPPALPGLSVCHQKLFHLLRKQTAASNIRSSYRKASDRQKVMQKSDRCVCLWRREKVCVCVCGGHAARWQVWQSHLRLTNPSSAIGKLIC